MKRENIQIGSSFDYWTVIGSCIKTGNARRWLCRCTCGIERYVLERSLVYGTTHSCGCQRRTWVQKPVDEGLKGQRFGDLTVLEAVTVEDRRYGIRWRCRCACGSEIELPQSALLSGKQTNCGCKTVGIYRDITGQRFGRLTALYPVAGRTVRGSKIWHCRCECGNETDIPYNTLLYSNTRSCGCKKKEHSQKLSESLMRVAGTSIDHLRSKKIPTNNTSGVRGVYKSRGGKYVARIAFQKKQYWLGAYATLAEAAAVRSEAEKAVNDQVTNFYERWKSRADADPQWAEENPIEIRVEQNGTEIGVVILPKME